MSGLKGQVILERRDSVAGLDFTLSDLQDCTVFLLGPLAALFMHRLQRCRVCVGPVAGATFMEGEWEWGLCGLKRPAFAGTDCIGTINQGIKK